MKDDIVPDVLKTLFDEFLETLDDEYLFESKDTDKCNADSVLNDFMTWYKNRQAQRHYISVVETND